MQTATATRPTQSEIGELLRQWRSARRLSQLDLALEANVSARHLSFVETGRARPSRDLVLQLADVLDVPLRDRNTLLTAAGFAPAFRETGLDAPSMAASRQALEFLLAKQEPFPAVVIDRLWHMVMMNQAAARLMGLLMPDMPADPDVPVNLMDAFFMPGGMREVVENWEETAQHLLRRLVHDSAADGGTGPMRALLDRLLSYPGVARLLAEAPSAPDTPMLCVWLKRDDFRLGLFSTIATFGTAQDITLQELRIELQFPADDQSKALLERLAEEG